MSVKVIFVVIFLMGIKVVGFLYEVCGYIKVRKDLW